MLARLAAERPTVGRLERLMKILPLFAFLIGAAAPITNPPGLIVRVLDNECHPLPGMAVTSVNTGQNEDRAVLATVSSAAGEVVFAKVPEGKYDVLVSGEQFIRTRLGPLTVWKSRTLRPTVVLNLSFDWVPTPLAAPK
jgi:hypothetical protein